MSINITNLGGVVNYNDNHKEVTIHNANNVSDIVRKFMADDVEPVAPANIPPKFFCVSEKFSEQNIRDRLAAELSHSVTKREYCRALYQLQHIGCINIDQYASDAKRAEVFNEYQSTFKLSASDFCKARASQYAQN